MLDKVSRNILKLWIEGFRKEDPELLGSLFAENASFKDPRFPRLHGKETIIEYYECLLSDSTAWGSVMFEGPYLFGNDSFSIRTRLQFTWRENGAVVDFPFVAFFRVRQEDGKIISYDEYWDTMDTLSQIGIDSWVAYQYVA